MREAPTFVINSARAVAEQYAKSEPFIEDLTVAQFAQIYGSVAV
jgi:hypothetical protein